MTEQEVVTRWVRESPDPEEWLRRLSARVEVEASGCWRYTGPVDQHGYGRFECWIDGKRIRTGAHRAMWLAVRGPISASLVIDHLCRNRLCIRIDHLDLVTNAVNTQRGQLGRVADPEQYPCGHPRTEGNTYRHSRGGGIPLQRCRACDLARRKRSYANRHQTT
jgi:hypothetical protein